MTQASTPEPVAMTALDMAAALIGGDVDQTRLAVLVEISAQEAASYCNRDVMPDAAKVLIAQIAVIKYNRLGSEGQASASYSGVSEAWIDGYPADIRTALTHYRRLRVI